MKEWGKEAETDDGCKTERNEGRNGWGRGGEEERGLRKSKDSKTE